MRLFRQWYTQSDPASLMKAQDKLLQTFVKTPFKRRLLPESVGGLNSVEFTSETGDTTVILAHGFGSGLGFFFNNVDALLRHSSVERVILVDWLGMGGSERPECHQRPIRRIGSSCWTSGWCDSRFTTSQAVDFFVDPFAEWMNATTNEASTRGDSKVTLVGHSLGGYLTARYMLKHSSPAVNKLVLASPVGFPPKPFNTLQGAQLPTTFRIMDALWSANMTPQQLVRIMGSTRGRQNTRRALVGRIPHLMEREESDTPLVDILAEYLYHITVAAPSGEYAMNSLLEPAVSPDTMGVFAREPLQALFNASRDGLSLESTLPGLRSIKVLFGDHDWMRPNEPSARLTMDRVQEQTRGRIETTVLTIPQAGHHLYLDNPTDFVRHIVND